MQRAYNMKTILLCALSVVVVFWLGQQGTTFWHDYQQIYIHEHALRQEDTFFYDLVCASAETAAVTGSVGRCHAIEDRRTLQD